MSEKQITPRFRVSYPSVFEARVAPGAAKAKFSISALFTDDPEVPAGSCTIADMKKAALQAAFDKFGNTDKTKAAIKSGKIKMPFLEPEEGKFPEEYTLLLRFNSDERFKPGVVDHVRGKDGGPRVITDPDELYPGCWARASVRAFGYDRSGNRGVSFGLGNVQKLGEGERLDSRARATDEFGGLVDDNGAESDDLSSDSSLDDMLS